MDTSKEVDNTPEYENETGTVDLVWSLFVVNAILYELFPPLVEKKEACLIFHIFYSHKCSQDSLRQDLFMTRNVVLTSMKQGKCF